MKKINLVLIAFVAVILFSCNNTAETEEVVEDASAEEVVKTVEAVGSPEIPNFESTELRAFTEEFAVYFDKSMALLRAGDMEGLAALESEGKALQEKGDALKNTVSEGDNALLENYLKNKATEMLSASGLDNMNEKFEEESTK